MPSQLLRETKNSSWAEIGQYPPSDSKLYCCTVLKINAFMSMELAWKDEAFKSSNDTYASDV